MDSSTQSELNQEELINNPNLYYEKSLGTTIIAILYSGGVMLAADGRTSSGSYVANRVAEIMGKDIKELKIVNCHLGQGCSVCAIKDGKSVETSMGLTPMGGIPMGSRSGDLDPSILTYLMQKENLKPDDMNYILNKESGIYGVSSVSVDMRDIEVIIPAPEKQVKTA